MSSAGMEAPAMETLFDCDIPCTTQPEPSVGNYAILEQARPSIAHKIQLLEAYKKIDQHSHADCKAFIRKAQIQHAVCCGRLTKEKLKQWARCRVAQGWDSLSHDQQKSFRLDAEARADKGLKRYGGRVAVEEFDPFVRDLLDQVKARVESERLKGNSVAFDDVQVTFRNKLLAERTRRDQINENCDLRIQTLLQSSTPPECLKQLIGDINQERLSPLLLSGSDGWVASKLEKIGCIRKPVNPRSESKMCDRFDPEFLVHKVETRAIRQEKKVHPMLQASFDEMPFQFGKLPKVTWTTSAAENTRQNRESDQAYCQKHSTFREFLSVGTCSFPLGLGKLLLHCKEGCPGGKRAIDRLNREFPRALYAFAEGKGCCTKETWNAVVLPRIIFPSFARYRSTLKLWKHGRLNSDTLSCGLIHYDGATGHGFTESMDTRMQEEDLTSRKLFPNSSGHSQVQDMLHAIFKARAYQKLKHLQGMTSDLFDRDTDSHLTPGGYLRGPNVYEIGKALVDAYQSISTKILLSAWLITDNLTIEEAVEGLKLIGGNPSACTKEALWESCRGLLNETQASHLNFANTEKSKFMQNLQQRVAELGWAEEVPLHLDIEQVKYHTSMFEQAPLEYLVKVLRSQVPGFETRKVKGAEFPILAASPCLSLLWALRRRQPSVAEIQRLGLGKSIGALKKYAPEVTIQHAAQAVISAWMARWQAQGTTSSSGSAPQPPAVSQSSSSSSSSAGQAGPPNAAPPSANVDPDSDQPAPKKPCVEWT